MACKFELITVSPKQVSFESFCQIVRSAVKSDAAAIELASGINWRKCGGLVVQADFRELPFFGVNKLIVPMVLIHTTWFLALIDSEWSD